MITSYILSKEHVNAAITSYILSKKHVNTAIEKLNYYTFYLLNGQRKVFLGVDPQDAYTNNQSYTDGQQAIMMTDEGITDSYYWDDGSWVKKENFKLGQGIGGILSDITNGNISHNALEKYSAIFYEFENKDQLLISLKWGHFVFGWTKYIEVTYAEYQAGNYGDYGDNDQDTHHYLTCGSEYFHSNDITEALSTFTKRLTSAIPYQAINEDSRQLEDIYDHTLSEMIYGCNLTTQQELWLLGGLIRRLEPQDAKEVCTYIQAREQHDELYDQIQYYCDKLLITDKGQAHFDNESFLTKHFHWKFKVLEQDSFGPLKKGIMTEKGIIAYG